MNTSRSIVLCAAFFAANMLVVGCGSSDDDPSVAAAGSAGSAGAAGSAAGAGSSAAGAAGSTAGGSAGTGGGSCPAIANGAPTISNTFMSAVPVPVGTGGAIVDGTYVMSGHIGYMGASTTPHTHAFTFKFSGTQLDLTGHDDDKADQSVSLLVKANAGTGAYEMATTCPVVGGKVGAIDSYTATATEIRLFESSKMQETILTKQ